MRDDERDWSRIEDILLAAGDVDGDALPAFLDRACGGDGTLRRTLEELLELDGEAGAALDAVVSEGAARSFGHFLERDVPVDRLGSYRLLEKLGEGGSGSVFLAERDDHEYELRVAIKVLRHGPWNRRLALRFRSERQILAGLDHPNIARLIDGGTTPEGSPYFVMELVEGEPIDLYCDRHGLSIDRRLDLFTAVCDAVHYAHRNLVVHRDLKPSNVYVTRDGVPKLLDFGIAKILEPGNVASPTEAGQETFTGGAPMTPRWASPEQLRGEAVTTASDVYSLGLLLHALLTGRRPFDTLPSGASFLDLRQHGASLERPSHAALDPGQGDTSAENRAGARGCRPGELSRRLVGDLDNIVGMALREETERRYDSAAQLAEDLERHRRSRPVRARPDTLGYRFSSFVRRHRLGVATASVISLVLVTGLITVTLQNQWLQEEKKRNQLQRERAQGNLKLIESLFSLAKHDTERGSSITAKDLLERGDAEVSKLPREPNTAQLMSKLAQLYRDLGLSGEAVPLLEKALDIRTESMESPHPEIAANLAALAIALAGEGNFQRAETFFERAYRMRRELYGDAHALVADSLNNLALVNHDLGHYSTARRYYQESLDTDRALGGGSALTLSNLGLLLFDEGAYAEAVEQFRLALDAHAAADDDDVDVEGQAEAHQMLCTSLAELGRFEEARPHCMDSLDLRRTKVGDEHRDFARSLDALGFLELLQGRSDDAESLLLRALELRRRSMGEEHAETALTIEHLGEMHSVAGNLERAEEFLRRAVAAFEASLPDKHPLTSGARTLLAALLAETGRCNLAGPLVEQAVAVRQEAFEDDNWRLAFSRAVGSFCDALTAPPRSVDRTAAVDLLVEQRRTAAAVLPAGHRRLTRLDRWVASVSPHQAP
ncbi:MAG: serine/threonine-protein kinase [Acidobacteriota bacterium]